MGGRGSSEIQVQLFLGTLHVTQIPDAGTVPITHKAGKLSFRFI